MFIVYTCLKNSTAWSKSTAFTPGGQGSFQFYSINIERPDGALVSAYLLLNSFWAIFTIQALRFRQFFFVRLQLFAGFEANGLA
jgi:hypothetical protein